jgi:hypothetical protein
MAPPLFTMFALYYEAAEGQPLPSCRGARAHEVEKPHQRVLLADIGAPPIGSDRGVEFAMRKCFASYPLMTIRQLPNSHRILPAESNLRNGPPIKSVEVPMADGFRQNRRTGAWAAVRKSRSGKRRPRTACPRNRARRPGGPAPGRASLATNRRVLLQIRCRSSNGSLLVQSMIAVRGDHERRVAGYDAGWG